MFNFNTAVLLALAAVGANAHVVMQSPAPINPHPDLNAPMGSASVFPCNVQGGQSAVAALLESATPETEWTAGGKGSFSFGTGGAFHEGGSCQASISEDGGKTFKVVGSFVGDCPAAGASFDFDVPAEAKGGKALFAWTWFNHSGNREMYMNCAAVNISGGGSGLDSLPDIFVANVPGVNDCSVPDSTDTDFKDSKCTYSGGNAAGGDAVSGSPSTGGGEEESTDPVEGEAPAPTPEAPATEAPATEAPATDAPAQGGNDGMYVPGPNGWKRSTRRHARDVRA